MTALFPPDPVIDRRARREAAEPDACRICGGSGIAVVPGGRADDWAETFVCDCAAGEALWTRRYGPAVQPDPETWEDFDSVPF